MPDHETAGPESIRDVKSCGFLIMRREPVLSFLLMKHTDRWDLPKGHVDPGETELVCAFRELEEETGIPSEAVHRDVSFRYTTEYFVRYAREPHVKLRKTLVVFLGWLEREVEIQLTEHPGYEWFPWAPPHQIQTQTIDPLLVETHLHLGNEF